MRAFDALRTLSPPPLPPTPALSRGKRGERVGRGATQDAPPPLQVQPEPTDGCSPPHASRMVSHTPSRFVRIAAFQNRMTRSPSPPRYAVRRASYATCSECWPPSNDDETRFDIQEVDDERPLGNLTPPSPPAQAAGAQCVPKPSLGIGVVPPQGSRAISRRGVLERLGGHHGADGGSRLNHRASGEACVAPLPALSPLFASLGGRGSARPRPLSALHSHSQHPLSGRSPNVGFRAPSR